MKKKPFSIISLIFLFLFLTGCCKSEDHQKENEDYSQTILVALIDGNSLTGPLIENIQMIRNYVQSKSLQPNQHIYVYWAPRGKDAELMEIVKNTESSEETKIKAKIIVKRTYPYSKGGEIQKLKTVFGDMLSLSKSKRYGLILGSHGTSWLPKSGQTRSFGQKGHLVFDIEELERVIPKGVFEFILFDACYMGGVEVAYQLRETAPWILFYPGEILIKGLPYEQALVGLTTPKEVNLKAAASALFEYYANSNFPYISYSIVNTKYMEELANICKEISQGKEETFFNLAINNIQIIERLHSDYNMLFDFEDVFRQLATPEQYTRFQTALNHVVVDKNCTEKLFYGAGEVYGAFPIKRYSGLSVFLPQKDFGFLNNWYLLNTAWGNYLFGN